MLKLAPFTTAAAFTAGAALPAYGYGWPGIMLMVASTYVPLGLITYGNLTDQRDGDEAYAKRQLTERIFTLSWLLLVIGMVAVCTFYQTLVSRYTFPHWATAVGLTCWIAAFGIFKWNPDRR